MSILPSLLLIIITSLFISSIICSSNSDGDDHFKGAVFNVNYKFYGRNKAAGVLDKFKAFDRIRHVHLLASGVVDLKID
ncbi:hypothetical protein Tco_0334758, partial [Tanacetum coccineum]